MVELNPYATCITSPDALGLILTARAYLFPIEEKGAHYSPLVEYNGVPG
jgi:hypothetical protein